MHSCYLLDSFLSWFLSSKHCFYLIACFIASLGAGIHAIVLLHLFLLTCLFFLMFACFQASLTTIVRLDWVDPSQNAYNSLTTHGTNTKLWRSTPIHNPVIILEYHYCKPLVIKLAKDPHNWYRHHNYGGYELRNVWMTVTWHHDVTHTLNNPENNPEWSMTCQANFFGLTLDWVSGVKRLVHTCACADL